MDSYIKWVSCFICIWTFTIFADISICLAGYPKIFKKNGDGDTDDGDDGADTILMFCLCCEIMIGQGLPLD